MSYGKERTLTHLDSWAVKETEITIQAGVPTKIITFVPGRKEAFAIANNVPWKLKLRKKDGTELKPDTKFSIALKKNNQMLKDQVSPDISYRKFFEVSETNQYNTEYINSLRVRLGRKGNADLLFEELEEMIVYLITTEDIILSWDNSKIEIPAVEFKMEEIAAMGIKDSPTEHYGK